jgi:hypothetical protein
MHQVAERWVRDEPGNRVALDLLASSYRKLADELPLVGDHVAARADYLKAIEIGRKVLADEPGNMVFQRHLGIALEDLAGVAYTEHSIAEARSLYGEAERLFLAESEADPDVLDTQFRLIRAQTRFASLERDESQFERASELFGRALERMSRLHREGRLDGPDAVTEQQIRNLREEIAACALGPAALGDLDALRSRPPREVCLMLPIRARARAEQGRPAEALAAAAALCDLQLDRANDLYAQARALGLCLRLLGDRRWSTATPPVPTPEWQALHGRCADRAVAVLTLAIERGLDPAGAIVLDDTLAPLRGHPGYQKLADRLREPPPSPGQ